MRRSNCNSRFLHPSLVAVSKQILATLPPPMDRLYMCNSGSEANDLALRLAGDFTGGSDVIVIDHAYHGHLLSTIAISPYKFNGKGGKGQPDNTHIAPCPDVYRGKHRLNAKQRNDPEQLALAGQKYADEVDELIKSIESKGRKLKAFIMEALISCGGQITPPPGYLRKVIELVHAAGGVVIIDEVQTGFGRVGELFWAFRLQGEDLCPDIVTMGKPMGNGFPVSGVAVRHSVAANFGGGMQYFNTFGGNPVSCAAVLAVLGLLRSEGLVETAAEKGRVLLHRLRELQARHPSVVGDVRGVGLFAGVELIKETKDVDSVGEPDGDLAGWMILELRGKHGVLVSAEGPHGNVLKFKPPMCFSFNNIHHMVDCMDESLGRRPTSRN